jgi:hypothetical protein
LGGDVCRWRRILGSHFVLRVEDMVHERKKCG